MYILKIILVSLVYKIISSLIYEQKSRLNMKKYSKLCSKDILLKNSESLYGVLINMSSYSKANDQNSVRSLACPPQSNTNTHTRKT